MPNSNNQSPLNTLAYLPHNISPPLRVVIQLILKYNDYLTLTVIFRYSNSFSRTQQAAAEVMIQKGPQLKCHQRITIYWCRYIARNIHGHMSHVHVRYMLSPVRLSSFSL